MTTAALHPYDYWLFRGRKVVGKAKYWARLTPTEFVPLFSEDQTTEVRDDPRTEWPEVVTTEVRDAARPTKSTSKNVVYLRYNSVEQRVTVWIGSKKELGNRLRSNKQVPFRMRSPGLWEPVKSRSWTLDQAVALVRNIRDKYNVVLKVDGKETPFPEGS